MNLSKPVTYQSDDFVGFRNLILGTVDQMEEKGRRKQVDPADPGAH
jgi:hypothetical protein